jgi:hypothetical protein
MMCRSGRESNTLEVPPISWHGNVIEIARHSGGEERLVDAVRRLQTLPCAA